MKRLSFLLLTFLCSVFAQENTTTTIDPAEDQYYSKATVTKSDNYGFTIEYFKYYKVVTNLQSSRRYCLVGFSQELPEGCDASMSFSTPITQFSVDNEYDTVMPFIELLGIQNLVVKTNTSLVTSPCFADSISDTSTINTPMTISNRTSGGHYVDFSPDNDSLTPLQKAAWLMYLGAFFDLEDISVAVYTQLSNNYECHKNNVLASISKATPVPIGWTTYDASKKLYTLHSEVYYDHLVRDAGGKLVYTNPAQPDVFDMTATMDQTLLANQLHGVNYVIDTSAQSLDYDAYISGNGFYFRPNSINNISAILSNKVYTTNGLLNAHNVSDWSQRAVARPDLALLEIIKFLYPDFKTSSDMFPIWIKPFMDATDRRYMTQDIYGGCSNISTIAFEQSQCTFGATASNASISKKLSSGDKAGISVGTVVFCIIAVLVGIWAFRRYQRRKRRHNFYRMNDL